MKVNTNVRQVEKVAIMFSPEMKERIDKIAVNLGMPPSTVCSYAVASWVQQQENNKGWTLETLMNIALADWINEKNMKLKLAKKVMSHRKRKVGEPEAAK